LGLAITERAVRMHGGSVQAVNAADGGLSVELKFRQDFQDFTGFTR
jgi:signal transduction histidine kinase